MQRLRRNQPLGNNSKLLFFSPFLGQDGVIRLEGLIKKVQLSYDNLHPIMFPPNGHLIGQIIQAFYRNLQPLGEDFVLAHICQHFWVIDGWEAVKRVKWKFTECVKEMKKHGI